MNIAQQIKAFHQDSEGKIDWESFESECADKAVTIDQDYYTESTTYIFADGSCILWSGFEVSAYGCAQ